MSDAFPLRHGAANIFTLVREFFLSSGFTEEHLLKHFQAPSLASILSASGLQSEHLEKGYQAPGLLPLLSRMFLSGRRVSAEELSAYVSDSIISAWRELGMLDTSGQATVLLCPALGLYIATDRRASMQDPGYSGDDFVLSGAELASRQFLDNFSKGACERFLHVSSGAGLVAIYATRFAREVVGTDRNPRAIRFAEFNAMLNGCGQPRFLCGDLLAPVKEMKFDRIVFRSPYEPPVKESTATASGGKDGEAVMARFFEKVPVHLEPGGRAYCMITGTDRSGEPMQNRIRRWLGRPTTECDLILCIRESYAPNEYAIQNIFAANRDSWELEKWNAFYDGLNAHKVIVGHTILQRHNSTRAPFTRRVNLGPQSGAEEMDKLMDLETRVSEWGAEQMLEIPALPSQGWELHVRHRSKQGHLQPDSYTFVLKSPFDVSLPVPAWAAMLVSRADGVATGRQHLEFLRTKGEITTDEFQRVLHELAAVGIVRLEQAR